MPELIHRGHLYIAQPPLYQVRKGKKSRYLNTDEEMENFLFELALDSAKVTASQNGAKKTIQQKTLLKGMRAAMERERMISRLERVYGVPRESVTACLAMPREKFTAPQSLTAEDLYAVFGDEVEFVNTREAQAELLEETDTEGNGHPRARVVRREGQVDLAFLRSHEFSMLLSHSEPLAALGHPPFSIVREDGSVEFETNDIGELHDRLLEMGKKGMSIQRYKGLGEMNAGELAETTMNPDLRTVLQVTSEDEAAAADLFETLMGGLVEPRKLFIEKHAPEVQNLDI